MSYHYEELGDQRFQQLCQALLLESFPHAQCLPIGQADGGRDAVQTTKSDAKSKPIIVFQVKFHTKANAEKHPHLWLRKKLDEEKESIRKLVTKGMERYILITNVPGTSALDKGSIDQVQSILDELVPVPAQCWWRDDIDRRLERNTALPWHYPEILTGRDVFAVILSNVLSEDRERRDSALRAYLTSQFKIDEEVRFKQVELQNKLFDLFIDVPISVGDTPPGSGASFLDEIIPWQLSEHDEESEAMLAYRRRSTRVLPRHHRSNVGAASFLLRSAVRSRFRRLVLEGAPGQGKSTIAQYICQIHRIRLLNKSEEFGRVAAHHLTSPIRLPMKVDLRDLAVWLEGRDPFSVHSKERPPQWRASLEAFLAAQISHFAGGAQFSVSDLHAVAKVSHLLIALDGFDEVADVESRRQVVDAIVKATERLEELAPSIQVVVTSRPAAFANSPGFPSRTFLHFDLDSVTKEQAVQYAIRWARARGLTESERTEFIDTLKGKLEEPHLRELARNPMQLAILLSLILPKGASLPDKRTAMYDSYIEVFFGRESEKSAIVREHRELLIDIHRYLAWNMHVDAEESASQGIITRERLESVLLDYLKNEGHDTSLVGTLFTGMVERVVALVFSSGGNIRV